MLRMALTVKPDQVTLVPERREELTTEGGLDVVLNSVQLKPVVRTLRDAGLRGATEDYDEPDNSLVDRVLERGRGLPIALSALAMGVARRVGAPLEGIGLPGHFVVADPSGEEPRYVDPFNGWAEIDRDGCARLARETAGVQLEEAHLAPVGPRAILARTIANLRGSYLARRRLADVLWCVDVALIVAPGQAALVRERVALLVGLGRYDDAEGEARAYLERHPGTDERPALERHIAAVQEMRRSMN